MRHTTDMEILFDLEVDIKKFYDSLIEQMALHDPENRGANVYTKKGSSSVMDTVEMKLKKLEQRKEKLLFDLEVYIQEFSDSLIEQMASRDPENRENSIITITKIVSDAMKKIKLNNNHFLNLLSQHDYNESDLDTTILIPCYKYFLLTKFHVIAGIDINEKIISKAFSKLLKAENLPKLLKIGILKIMLDYGMPINKFICNNEDDNCPDTLTPLHFSIRNNNIDFVSVLLDYGSDINMNEAGYLSRSSLWFAVEFCDESMVDLLLKNGANVNYRIPFSGQSVFEKACNMNKPEIVYMLLKHGADLDVSDDNPWFFNLIVIFNFSKELAKLVFEGQPFCNKNLEYVQNDETMNTIFNRCLKELQKMKNQELQDGLSLYDIFKMRNQTKRMVFLLKNQKLVDTLSSLKDFTEYRYWGNEMNYFFKRALQRTKYLQAQEKKLYEADLDKQFHLPSEIIERIAYFANVDLFGMIKLHLPV